MSKLVEVRAEMQIARKLKKIPVLHTANAGERLLGTFKTKEYSMQSKNELVPKLIMTKKDIHQRIESLGNDFGYDAVLDLIEILEKHFPVSEENTKKFPKKYRVAWLCREMYLMGFLHALQQRNKEIISKIKKRP